MMNEENIKTMRALYHPSQRAEELVSQIIKAFDYTFTNGIKWNEVGFNKGALTLGDLDVKSLILSTNTHLGVEVHWHPKPSISTERDPFCSAYILTEEELALILNKMREIRTEMDKIHK